MKLNGAEKSSSTAHSRGKMGDYRDESEEIYVDVSYLALSLPYGTGVRGYGTFISFTASGLIRSGSSYCTNSTTEPKILCSVLEFTRKYITTT